MATVKKPGPPVPPRPQHTNATASLLKAQRESFVNSFNRSATTPTKSPTTPPAISNAVKAANITVAKEPSAQLQPAQQPQPAAPPVVSKKPALPANGVGRTIIYKSPSMTMQNKPQIAAKATPAPKPPLKARKAPDVPTAIKPRVNGGDGETALANAVNLNRHHSMGAAKTAGPSLKDAPPRLSLGRADFEKVSHKIHLDQLQPALPLPKPRKIVQMPVATLDLDDDDDDGGSTTTTTGSSTFYTSTPLSAGTPTPTSGMKIFRRSKTTLDNLASRVSVTTIASNAGSGNGNSSSNGGSFLGGKTVELKNNLKNAAERLFSELIVSQQKHHHNHHHATNSSNSSSENGQGALMITKHERAIQHQAVVEQQIENEQLILKQQLQQQQQQQQQQIQNAKQKTVAVADSGGVVGDNKQNAGASSSESLNNCTTRININSTSLSSEIENVLKSPEKKTAFHEILISELAAMRAKSSSMENLQTIALNAKPPPPQSPLVEAVKRNANEMQPTTKKAVISTTTTTATTAAGAPTLKKFPIRSRCNSLEDHDDPDTEDADADNIDDIEGDDDHDLRKSLNVVVASAKGTPRKRTPSGCSSDSSPYGTERSARIRTSDWIEVGDNGKQVTLTSCHISLEDSGLEDEERMDDMSSSGVGDSWDSVKEAAQHEKRSRTSVKRVMSITELPPLPKSLSGFNKMLGSDSGLLSDAEASFECNNNNNSNSNSSDNVLSKLECQKEESNSENNNNNSSSSIGDNGVSTTASASSSESPDNISTSSSSEATTTTAIGAATTTTTTTATANSPGCTLNAQLALLKKEMYGLRQLDLSLLSQLWTLNDSIQEFRNIIQEHEEVEDENDDDDEDNDNDNEDDDDEEGDDDDVVSYSRPSRSTSSYDPESSEGDEDIHHINNKANNMHSTAHMNTKKNLGATPKIITTQPKLRKTNSIEYLNESGTSSAHHLRQSAITLKPSVDMKPVPRMRSAPPPPPANHQYRKAAAPPRPT